jgi:hypothetical protein
MNVIGFICIAPIYAFASLFEDKEFSRQAQELMEDAIEEAENPKSYKRNKQLEKLLDDK